MQSGYEIQRMMTSGFGRVSCLHGDIRSATDELKLILIDDPRGTYRIVEKSEKSVVEICAGVASVTLAAPP